MYLQKHIDYLVQNKLVKEMGIKNLIEFSSKSVWKYKLNQKDKDKDKIWRIN